MIWKALKDWFKGKPEPAEPIDPYAPELPPEVEERRVPEPEVKENPVSAREAAGFGHRSMKKKKLRRTPK